MAAESNPKAVKDEKEEEEYDPHLFREKENTTNYPETLINMLKGCLGTGILAMPEAFKNSGIYFGLGSTAVITIILTYCLHMLIRSQYILSKRFKVGNLAFPAESVKMSFESGPSCFQKMAPISPYVVDFFLCLHQLGICSAYIIFVSLNVKAVVDSSTNTNYSLSLYLIVFLVPFIIVNCIRSMKVLAKISIISNVLSLVSFGIVYYYVFEKKMPDLKQRPAFGSLYTLPIFLGTTVFSIEAVGVIIAIESNMKNPKQFGGCFGILNISMAIVCLLYASMGFFGYWKFGEGVFSTITLNLPPKDIAVKVVRLTYAFCICLSYALQCYVPVHIIWDNYVVKLLEGSKFLLLWEMLLRTALVFLTFIAAISVPLLGLFMSLIGSLCLSFLGIILPAIMETCVYWPDELGPGKIILIKNILIAIIGMIFLCAGCFSSISEIIISLKKNKW